MAHRPSYFQSRPRGFGEWFAACLGALLVLIGLVLAAGGAWLIALGGSWYYLAAGIGLLLSGFAFLMASPWGVFLYLLTYAPTWVWAVWEVGWHGWALVPRVVAPTVLLIAVLLCVPVLRRRTMPGTGIQGGEARRFAPAGAGTAALATAALIVVGAVTLVTGLSLAQDRPAPASGRAAAAPGPAPDPAAGASPGDWPSYGRTAKALRYSPLDRITPGNVAQLKRVWTFRTGDMPNDRTEGEYSPETTPIKVGDSLYLCSATNAIIALHAATGKERWRYDPSIPDDAIPYGATCRGVAYYRDPATAPDRPCAERILESTLDARLIAVDAQTGRLCPDFGVDGQVDLWRGMGERIPSWYGEVAAPVIVRGIVVLGGQVLDGQAENAPSGVIRGYDAVTGKLAWAWDMCRPDLTGEPGPGDTYTPGTPNMWTSPAGDEELGYVYVPLGNSAVDYYGGNRKACENDYSSSLVAIDVTSGKPVWRFQTVHYDLWDYDLGSQPSLVSLPSKGASVPALILPSKQGEIYVLDRRTGKPLFPVEERKVPSGGVEPGRLSPTQPFSTYHSLARPPLQERDMWGMSPVDQLWCRIQFRRASYRGEYTPPTDERHYIEYPSYNGGSDWGSVAVDPERGILVANYNDMANYDRLLSREQVDRRNIVPVDKPEGDKVPADETGDAQEGAPYGIEVIAGWREDITGLMCTAPPYGGIRAIDLATGKTLWDQPLGEARANGPFGIPSLLPLRIGTPNNGGSVVTAGGLVFIAAATDNLIRAIDIETGKVLWKDTLPAGGQANPITFEADGKQYVAIMAGGHHFMKTPVGDYVVAWALSRS
ncbi:MAG: membrane-bound PQQ-dependent dehydrogenase, glucose/quinate/shikimate family [Parvibaculaceae bacterium]